MANDSGEAMAAALLSTLPHEVAELILGRLGGEAAERLRALLARVAASPADPDQLDKALNQFFDMQRIDERPVAPSGEYRPVAAPAAASGTGDPVDQLRAIPPDRLSRVLAAEQPAAVAMVLSSLDPGMAGQVMKRLPPELRADVIVRLTRPSTRNQSLLLQVARAVAAKGQRLADQPPEQTVEDRTNALVEILRALPRTDRTPVLQRLDNASPDLSAAVRERLYRIEDLLRIPDRQLQLLLSELEVKKLAIALKDCAPEVRSKVETNMSSRAKAVLAEESELLGQIPASRRSGNSAGSIGSCSQVGRRRANRHRGVIF